MKWLLIHLNFNGCCYITKVDVRQSQFYLWMFLHHTSETAIFTWNSMVVTTRHKWDVLTSYSCMDVFTRHNGRCYWPLIIPVEEMFKKESLIFFCSCSICRLFLEIANNRITKCRQKWRHGVRKSFKMSHFTKILSRRALIMPKFT